MYHQHTWHWKIPSAIWAGFRKVVFDDCQAIQKDESRRHHRLCRTTYYDRYLGHTTACKNWHRITQENPVILAPLLRLMCMGWQKSQWQSSYLGYCWKPVLIKKMRKPQTQFTESSAMEARHLSGENRFHLLRHDPWTLSARSAKYAASLPANPSAERGFPELDRSDTSQQTCDWRALCWTAVHNVFAGV